MQYNLPVADSHVADPAVFWHKELMAPHAIELGWCYEDDRYMSHQEYLDAVLRRLDKNPNLKYKAVISAIDSALNDL